MQVVSAISEIGSTSTGYLVLSLPAGIYRAYYSSWEVHSLRKRIPPWDGFAQGLTNIKFDEEDD